MSIELLYGRHAVHEALRARRRRFYSLDLAANVRQTGLVQQIVHLSQKAGCAVQTVERAQFERMLPGANHQGIALEAGPYPYVGLDTVLSQAKDRGQPPLLLLLDHLEDPQNVGALLRTAEAMGVHGAILPGRRAASITPSVSNASSGAVEHLSVVEVTNLTRTMEDLKRQGIWIAGLEDRPDAQLLGETDLTGPLALVVGSEGKGLSRLVRETCDWLIRIPTVGRVDSLNAAVAGSVALVYAHLARETLRTGPAKEKSKTS